MARIPSILAGLATVLGLIFIAAAIRHSHVEGYAFFSLENFRGALPLFLGCVALLIIGFLVPWERLSDRGPADEESQNKDDHR